MAPINGTTVCTTSQVIHDDRLRKLKHELESITLFDADFDEQPGASANRSANASANATSDGKATQQPGDEKSVVPPPLDIDALVNICEQWQVWPFDDQLDLQEWVHPLNAIDAFLIHCLHTYPALLLIKPIKRHKKVMFKTSLPQLQPKAATTLEDVASVPSSVQKDIITVLRFLINMLKNASNKNPFNSVDELVDLLAAANDEIAATATEALCFLSTLPPMYKQEAPDSHQHSTVLHSAMGPPHKRLMALARGWGSRGSGLGLMTCVSADDSDFGQGALPVQAGELDFSFFCNDEDDSMMDVGDGNGNGNENSMSKSKAGGGGNTLTVDESEQDDSIQDESRLVRIQLSSSMIAVRTTSSTSSGVADDDAARGDDSNHGMGGGSTSDGGAKSDSSDDGAAKKLKRRRVAHALVDKRIRSTAELFFICLEKVGRSTSIPADQLFALLAELRLARSFHTRATRVDAIQTRLRALIAILHAHPSHEIVSGYFHAQPELCVELIDVLRPTVSSASISTSPSAIVKEDKDSTSQKGALHVLAKSSTVPYEVRVLAVETLTALVARREGIGGSLTGVARHTNILSELGVGKGRYLGILPTLIRFSLATLNSFLLDSSNQTSATSMGATTSTSASAPASVPMSMSSSTDTAGATHSEQDTSSNSLGFGLGLAFMQMTREEQLSWDTLLDRALGFVDTVLSLTSIVVLTPYGTSALTDCGLIPALLTTISVDPKPCLERLSSTLTPSQLQRVKSMLAFISAQSVHIMETAIANHNNAFNAFNDLRGVEILTTKLLEGATASTTATTTNSTAQVPAAEEDDGVAAMDCDPPETSDGAASNEIKDELEPHATEAGVSMSTAANPRAVAPEDRAVMPFSYRVLLFNVITTLTVVFHQESTSASSAAPSGATELRKPTLTAVVIDIMENANLYGGFIVSLAGGLITEVMNSDPHIVKYVHTSGMATSFLSMLCEDIDDEPQLPAIPELIAAIPNILSALSLTTDGAKAVKAANPFPAFLRLFRHPKYAMPRSRCLLNDIAAIVGTGLDEIMRHISVLKPLVMRAVADALHKVADFARELANKEALQVDDYEDGIRPPAHLEDSRTCLMQYALNFGQMLEHTLHNDDHYVHFMKASGLEAMLRLHRDLMPNGLQFLSHISCLSCPAMSTLTHSTTQDSLTLAFKCIATRYDSQKLLHLMVGRLTAQLDALELKQKHLSDVLARSSHQRQQQEQQQDTEKDRQLRGTALMLLEGLPDLPLHKLDLKGFAPVAVALSDYLRHVVTLQWTITLLCHVIRHAIHATSESSTGWSSRDRKWKKELISPSFERLIVRLSRFQRSAIFEVCRVRTQPGFDERELRRLQGDADGERELRYRLRIVCSEGAVVRDGIEIDSCASVGNMEMSEITDAFDRCVNKCGVLRYRTSRGWVSEQTRGHGREPIAEVLAVWTAPRTQSLADSDTPAQPRFEVGLTDIRTSSANVLARMQSSYSEIFSWLAKLILSDFRSLPAQSKMSFHHGTVGRYLSTLIRMISCEIRNGFEADLTVPFYEGGSYEKNETITPGTVRMYLGCMLDQMHSCLVEEKRERRTLNNVLLVALMKSKSEQQEQDEQTYTFLDAMEYILKTSLDDFAQRSRERQSTDAAHGQQGNATMLPMQLSSRISAASLPPLMNLVRQVLAAPTISTSHSVQMLESMKQEDVSILVGHTELFEQESPSTMADFKPEEKFSFDSMRRTLHCCTSECLLRAWKHGNMKHVPSYILNPFVLLISQTLEGLELSTKPKPSEPRFAPLQESVLLNNIRGLLAGSSRAIARQEPPFVPDAETLTSLGAMGFNHDTALNAILRARSNNTEVALNFALANPRPDEATIRRNNEVMERQRQADGHDGNGDTADAADNTQNANGSDQTENADTADNGRAGGTSNNEDGAGGTGASASPDSGDANAAIDTNDAESSSNHARDTGADTGDSMNVDGGAAESTNATTASVGTGTAADAGAETEAETQPSRDTESREKVDAESTNEKVGAEQRDVDVLKQNIAEWKSSAVTVACDILENHSDEVNPQTRNEPSVPYARHGEAIDGDKEASATVLSSFLLNLCQRYPEEHIHIMDTLLRHIKSTIVASDVGDQTGWKIAPGAGPRFGSLCHAAVLMLRALPKTRVLVLKHGLVSRILSPVQSVLKACKKDAGQGQGHTQEDELLSHTNKWPAWFSPCILLLDVMAQPMVAFDFSASDGTAGGAKTTDTRSTSGTHGEASASTAAGAATGGDANAHTNANANANAGAHVETANECSEYDQVKAEHRSYSKDFVDKVDAIFNSAQKRKHGDNGESKSASNATKDTASTEDPNNAMQNDDKKHIKDAGTTLQTNGANDHANDANADVDESTTTDTKASHKKDTESATTDMFKALPVYQPLMSKEASDAALRLCLSILRRSSACTNPGIIHATLLLLMRLLRNTGYASQCLRAGVVEKILALPNACRFVGHTTVVNMIVRRLLEDESTLQANMETEIRGTIAKLQGRKRNVSSGFVERSPVSSHALMQHSKQMACRNSLCFVKALFVSVKFHQQAGSDQSDVRVSPLAMNERTERMKILSEMPRPTARDRSRQSIGSRHRRNSGASHRSKTPRKDSKRGLTPKRIKRERSDRTSDDIDGPRTNNAMENPSTFVITLLINRIAQQTKNLRRKRPTKAAPCDFSYSESFLWTADVLELMADLIIAIPACIVAVCKHKHSRSKESGNRTSSAFANLHHALPGGHTPSKSFLCFLLHVLLPTNRWLSKKHWQLPEPKLTDESPEAKATRSKKLVAFKRIRVAQSSARVVLSLVARPGEGRRKAIAELVFAMSCGTLGHSPNASHSTKLSKDEVRATGMHAFNAWGELCAGLAAPRSGGNGALSFDVIKLMLEYGMVHALLTAIQRVPLNHPMTATVCGKLLVPLEILTRTSVNDNVSTMIKKSSDSKNTKRIAAGNSPPETANASRNEAAGADVNLSNSFSDAPNDSRGPTAGLDEGFVHNAINARPDRRSDLGMESESESDQSDDVDGIGMDVASAGGHGDLGHIEDDIIDDIDDEEDDDDDMSSSDDGMSEESDSFGDSSSIGDSMDDDEDDDDDDDDSLLEGDDDNDDDDIEDDGIEDDRSHVEDFIDSMVEDSNMYGGVHGVDADGAFQVDFGDGSNVDNHDIEHDGTGTDRVDSALDEGWMSVENSGSDGVVLGGRHGGNVRGSQRGNWTVRSPVTTINTAEAMIERLLQNTEFHRDTWAQFGESFGLRVVHQNAPRLSANAPGLARADGDISNQLRNVTEGLNRERRSRGALGILPFVEQRNQPDVGYTSIGGGHNWNEISSMEYAYGGPSITVGSRNYDVVTPFPTSRPSETPYLANDGQLFPNGASNATNPRTQHIQHPLLCGANLPPINALVSDLLPHTVSGPRLDQIQDMRSSDWSASYSDSLQLVATQAGRIVSSQSIAPPTLTLFAPRRHAPSVGWTDDGLPFDAVAQDFASVFEGALALSMSSLPTTARSGPRASSSGPGTASSTDAGAGEEQNEPEGQGGRDESTAANASNAEAQGMDGASEAPVHESQPEEAVSMDVESDAHASADDNTGPNDQGNSDDADVDAGNGRDGGDDGEPGSRPQPNVSASADAADQNGSRPEDENQVENGTEADTTAGMNVLGAGGTSDGGPTSPSNEPSENNNDEEDAEVASSLAQGLRLSPGNDEINSSGTAPATESSTGHQLGAQNENESTLEATTPADEVDQSSDQQQEDPGASVDTTASNGNGDVDSEGANATNANEESSRGQGTGSPAQLQCPAGIDLEAFNSLPLEMQQDIVDDARAQAELVLQLDEGSSLDPGVLAALPEDMRREAIEQDRRERGIAALPEEPADPANAEEMDNASFIASLSPELRHEILTTAADSFLQSLPPEIIAEAQLLRERASSARRDHGDLVQRGGQVAPEQPATNATANPPSGRTSGNASARDAGEGGEVAATSSRRRQRSGKIRAELDKNSIICMPDGGPVALSSPFSALDVQAFVRLYFLLSPVRPFRLMQKNLSNIIVDRDLRRAFTSIFINLLHDDSTSALAAIDQLSLRNSGADIGGAIRSADGTQTDNTVEFPPSALIGAAPEILGLDRMYPASTLQRRPTNDTMASIAANLPVTARGSSKEEILPYVVAYRIVDSLQYLCKNSTRFCLDLLVHQSFKDKDGSGSSTGFDLLLDLLEKRRYTKSSANLENLLTVLETAVSPLSSISRHMDEEMEVSPAEAEAAAASGKEWVSVPRVEVSQRRLQILCSVLRLESCRDTSFGRVNTIVRRLCRLHGNRGHVLAELASVAHALGVDAIKDLKTLNIRLSAALSQRQQETKTPEDAEASASPPVGSASNTIAVSTSTSELKLLRVLQTLHALCVDPGEDGAYKKLEGNTVVTFEMVHLLKAMDLDSLWDELTSCLKIVQVLEGVSTTPGSEGDGDDADNNDADANDADDDDDNGSKRLQNSVAGLLTRFLPSVEAFFVANASVTRTKQKSGDEDDDDDEDESNQAQDGPLRGNVNLGHLVGGDRVLNFVSANKVLVNALIRNNPSLIDKGLRTLIQVPQCRVLLSFDVKRQWFKTQVRRLRQQANRRFGSLRLQIRRKHVFEDAYHQLLLRNADEMRGRLHITFRNEEGVDAGGLSREFFGILAKEIFNPNYALFTSTEDGSTFQPNPNSAINPDHLSFFRFVGRIVGKAVADGYLLDAHFTRSLYKHMLGIKPTHHDMEAIDPDYYKNLKTILQYDLDDLGLELTFSIEDYSFGRNQIIDLIPNGRKIKVSEESKSKYVSLVCQHRMTTAISSQIKAYLDGFYELVSPGLISIFTPKELELLISGLPDIDVHDLKQNTDYQGWKPADEQIQWFWNILFSLSRNEKASFLQFVTGSSKVPLAGFSELPGMRGVQKFSIHKATAGPKGALMSAHTCFNSLDLPQYKSEDELKEKLLYAINEGSGAFMFA